jgi:predicted RNA polymerase sigma factor
VTRCSLARPGAGAEIGERVKDEEVERLFRTYNTALVRYLTRRLGDRDWAEEVAQETFLRALRQDSLRANAHGCSRSPRTSCAMRRAGRAPATAPRDSRRGRARARGGGTRAEHARARAGSRARA